MSDKKNTSKFAREKRSAILKNRILKYNAYSEPSSDFFTMLKENYQSDKKSIQDIKKLQQKKKQIDKDNKKDVWVQEQRYLWNSMIKLEQEIATFIQNIVSYHDMEQFGENNLLTEIYKTYSGTNDVKLIISKKLRELKELLRRQTKNIKLKQQQQQDENGSISTLGPESHESIQAQYLLASRQQLNNHLSKLSIDIMEMQNQVNNEQNLILKILQTDQEQMTNQQKDDLLAQYFDMSSSSSETDGNDFNINIYLSDWKHRYDLLEQLYITECGVINAEYEANIMVLYKQLYPNSVPRPTAATTTNNITVANTSTKNNDPQDNDDEEECKLSLENEVQVEIQVEIQVEVQVEIQNDDNEEEELSQNIDNNEYNNNNNNNQISQINQSSKSYQNMKSNNQMTASSSSSSSSSSSMYTTTISFSEFKKYGGWTISDHEAFVKVCFICYSVEIIK